MCLNACVCVPAGMHVYGCRCNWPLLGPTRSCPVEMRWAWMWVPPSPTSPAPPQWCANPSQIQRQWLPVSWKISLHLNNFTWFQWLLLCHQASWRRMIPVNPPASSNLNSIKWVIHLFCFIVFFFFLPAIAGMKLPGSSVGEGQIFTEGFVYSTLTFKPVFRCWCYQIRWRCLADSTAWKLNQHKDIFLCV